MFNLCPLSCGRNDESGAFLYSTTRSFRKSLCMQSCLTMGKNERWFRAGSVSCPSAPPGRRGPIGYPALNEGVQHQATTTIAMPPKPIDLTSVTSPAGPFCAR